jgi:superoxide dismutase, Fe-Mn family
MRSKRRKFSLSSTRRRLGLIFSLAIAILSLTTMACQAQSSPVQTEPTEPASTEPATPAASAIQLPPLPYDFAALEPSIDAETMELHHDKHHATYVNNLNEAFSKHPELNPTELESYIRNLEQVPEDIRKAVQNNGGGHLNHTMFWEIMAPDSGGEPTGTIATAIQSTFGSFDAFKEQFEQAGVKQFGSGWAWLVLTPEKELQIISTANQDSPLMQGLYPILGNDLWEHAYYLSYRNRRAEYLSKWWDVVNWPEVENRYTQAAA